MKLFNFDKEILVRHIEHELKTIYKFKGPLDYVIKTLTKLRHSITITSLDKKIDLNKIKENEGKNYNWSTVTYKNVTLVIRRYRYHLTIFTRVFKDGKYPKTVNGAFTFNTDMDKFGDKHDEMMDYYYDKPFTDLNVVIKDLLEKLSTGDGSVHWVWNDYSLKRPEHVDIKVSFAENSIYSLDDFSFCMEELSQIYLELFSENEMIKKLKEFNTGEKLNDRYKIGKIITEVKDDYYHAVGMELIDTMNKNENRFQDVYSLARYYFEDVFKGSIYIYEGDVYVQGGKLEVGSIVAYKNEDYEKVLIFSEKYNKDAFVSIVKL